MMIQTLVIGQTPVHGQVILLDRVTVICHVTVSIHAGHDRFQVQEVVPPRSGWSWPLSRFRRREGFRYNKE